MATQRRKNAGKKAKEANGPAQPAWRQPPPRSRKQMRRNQATAPRPAPRPIASAVNREPAARLRFADGVRAYLRPALIILVILGCAVGVIQLLRLPQLTVTRTSIQIGGSQRISTQEIYETSGLEGHSVLLVRPTDVEARIAGIPGISGADVHVRLPNQVLVDVTEYTPVVAWEGITTTLWLSADGAEVPQTGELPPLRLNDKTGKPLEEGRQIMHYLLPNLVELHDARPDLSELFYGKLEGLYFRSPSGWTVWLGDDGPMAAKLAMLEATERKIAAQGVRPTVIDLRSSDSQAYWW
jgi:hypothetical protein